HLLRLAARAGGAQRALRRDGRGGPDRALGSAAPAGDPGGAARPRSPAQRPRARAGLPAAGRRRGDRRTGSRRAAAGPGSRLGAPAAWLLPAPVVWGMYTWGSYLPLFARRRRGSGRERKVALTFDDGPDPEHTPKVLDVLARENVKGTFFLIGQRAAAAPAVVRRIAEEGHDIGNHTWSHRGFRLCCPPQPGRQ